MMAIACAGAVSAGSAVAKRPSNGGNYDSYQSPLGPGANTNCAPTPGAPKKNADAPLILPSDPPAKPTETGPPLPPNLRQALTAKPAPADYGAWNGTIHTPPGPPPAETLPQDGTQPAAGAAKAADPPLNACATTTDGPLN